MLRGLVDTPARRLLLASGFLTFLAVGAFQSVYGPTFVGFLARYPIGLGEVGGIVSAHFLGSFAAIAASGLLLARFGYRPLLVAGAGAMALGAVGIAFSPFWWAALVSALVAGLGFGLLDVAVNLLFARSFGRSSTGALNLLNAVFGIGAVAGPLLVGLVAPALAPPFLILAVLTAGSGVLLARVAVPPPLPVAGAAAGVVRGPLVGFVVLFFLYVSAEVGVASWEPTFLAPVMGEARAAYLTSVFWAAMTLGRLLAFGLSRWFRPADLVLTATALGLLGAWVAGLPGAAAVAYAVVGFAFGPIFPTALAWLQDVFPKRSEQIVPIVFASANLGPVLSAPAIGWAVARTGPQSIPLVLAVAVLLLAVVVAALWRGTRTLPTRPVAAPGPAAGPASGSEGPA